MPSPVSKIYLMQVNAGFRHDGDGDPRATGMSILVPELHVMIPSLVAKCARIVTRILIGLKRWVCVSWTARAGILEQGACQMRL